MAQRYAAAGAEANRRGEPRDTAEGTADRLISAVMRVAHSLWPTKTAAHLVARTQVSERAAKFWLAERKEMSADALVRLLRSEEGFEFLDAIMADARPAWWLGCQRVLAIAQVRRRQAEDRRLLEQLEQDPGMARTRRSLKGAIDADRSLSAAIGRAEAALRLPATKHARRGADAQRAGSGLPHRTVAAASGA